MIRSDLPPLCLNDLGDLTPVTIRQGRRPPLGPFFCVFLFSEDGGETARCKVLIASCLSLQGAPNISIPLWDLQDRRLVMKLNMSQNPRIVLTADLK